MANEQPSLYPVFLDLRGRRCLVIGAGEIAERKTRGLAAAGARPTVIGGRAVRGVRQLAAAGECDWLERDFNPSDLDDAFLVIAATDDADLNKQVRQEAAARGVLVNTVDQPELCDFYLPAVIDRGALKIAVSTSGRSPALARRLRERLEREFGPEYAEYTEVVGAFREVTRRRTNDVGARRRAYARLLDADRFEVINDSRTVGLDGLADKYAD